MARDAEQTFYYHNQLLLRFLVFSTGIFLIVVTLVWWQGRGEVHAPVAPLTVRHFSEVAAMADVTKAYAFDARYIHDLETYPAIKARFFSDQSLDFSRTRSLEEALAEVRSAYANGNEGMRSHVYHTSYYIGNLLVLPGKTLQELLLVGRPNTTVLLETALADIRAAAIKIGEYYDVAPPSVYDAAFAGSVYYPAPSAPSLTVSEAAIALYLLAEIDNGRARTYEQQLVDFASHVLAAGAHFASDIQAALDLAEIYHKIMIDDPVYQELIASAAAEWVSGRAETVVRTEPLTLTKFSVRGFPYREGIYVNEIINNGYAPSLAENLSGVLRMTLEDTRIPDAVSRIYGVDLERGDVLPQDLMIQRRQYPFMHDSLEYASYNSASEYVAISRGDDGVVLLRKQGSLVDMITGIEPSPVVTDLEMRYDLGRLIIADLDPQSQVNRVQFAKLADRSAEVVMTLDDVSDPAIFDAERFFVTDAGVVKIVNGMDGTTEMVSGVSEPDQSDLGSTRRLWYAHELGLLVVADSLINAISLVPETQLTLYQVREEDGASVTADLLYAVTLGDTLIADLAVSPAGRYIALVSTQSLGTLEPNLLIFDVINGIIKKEIDLTDFKPGTVSLDAWLSL